MLLIIRGDENLVVVIKYGNGAHDSGVAAVQQADQLAHRIAAVRCHAIFTGDRQRLNDVGAGVHQLTLQLVIAVHHKKGAEQQPDHQRRGQD